MTELITPNKPSRHSAFSCCTPLDRFALSPLLPQSNQFYFNMSPMQPLQIAYISPEHNMQGNSRFDELLGGICDQCTAHIYRKNMELVSVINESVNKSNDQNETKEINTVKKDSSCKDLKEKNKDASTLKQSKQNDKVKHKDENENENRIIKRRKRKNSEQIKMLSIEYKKNPNWNKTTMSEMAQKTGLTEAQVYKWSWDQKKKIKE